MTSRACGLALLLASGAAARADDPEVAGALPGPEHGKAATCDASPVDPGAVEVEVGYAPTWDDGGAASTHGFTAAVTYGALPGVDLRFAAGLASASAGTGATASDAHLAARWRFLHLPGRHLEVAIASELVAPVGVSPAAARLGLGHEFWSARAALVATQDLGALTVSAEVAVGAPVAGDAHGLRSTAQANCALGWQVARWLQPELEVNYAVGHAVGGDAHVLAVTAGVVAPFGTAQRLVAAVQQGVWGRNATPTTAGIIALKTAL